MPRRCWKYSAGGRARCWAIPSAAWWRRNWRCAIRNASSGWCCCPPPAAAPAAHPIRCTNSPPWRPRYARGAWWNWATRAAMRPGSATNRALFDVPRRGSPGGHPSSAPTKPNHDIGARRQLEARRGHDTWERLPRLSLPVSVFGGRYDGIAPPDHQRALARRIPGARFRTVRRRPPVLPAGCSSLPRDPRRAARRTVGRAAPACSSGGHGPPYGRRDAEPVSPYGARALPRLRRERSMDCTTRPARSPSGQSNPSMPVIARSQVICSLASWRSS